MLSHRKVVKLWDTGRLSGFLTHRWTVKNGIKPVVASQKISKEAEARNLYALLSIVALVAVVILALTTLPENPRSLRAIIAFGSTVSLGFQGVALIILKPRRYTDAEWDFPSHYEKFLIWGKLNPVSTVGLSDEELEKTARFILNKTAAEIITLEMDPSRLASSEANKKRTLFREQFATLSRMGLVEGTFKSVFDQAREEIKKKAEMTDEMRPAIA